MISIRPYTAADRQICIDIFKSNMPKYFHEDELPQFERWLVAQEQEKPLYPENTIETYFLLEKDGIPIGCGGYYIDSTNPKAGFAWVMVHQHYHKKGLGRMLTEYRIEEIKRIYPHHTIHLDTSQYTYTFFEKFGFQVNKITENAYADGLHRYDMTLSNI